MARRAITQEFYDKLVEGFARHPGSSSGASKWAECDARTARRAWSVGWPTRGFRPIAAVIAEQQEAARALLEQRSADERSADRDAAEALATTARTDAAKESATEGQIARTAKHNALAALATCANLMKRGYKISNDLTDEELQDLTPLQRIKALKTIAEFNRDASTAADAAVKLERLILGASTANVTHQHAHLYVNVAPSEMEATIQRATEALDRAKKHGIIDAEVVSEPS